jgi:AcrR family transcriptional regulator
VTKGLQLLAREGYGGFSMRKLAALCGVSHAAPYKHFEGREDIIRAISERIAGEFGAALREAAILHPDDSRQQLVEMCVRYVRFLTHNPDYFRYVFMTDHGRAIDMQGGAVRAGGRLPLQEALGCAERYFRPKSGDGWTQDFLALWSMIHGLTLAIVAGTVACQGDAGDLACGLVERYVGR